MPECWVCGSCGAHKLRQGLQDREWDVAREQNKPDHKPIKVFLAFALFYNFSVTPPFFYTISVIRLGSIDFGLILVGYCMTSQVMPDSSGETENMNTSALLSFLK